MKNLDFEKVNKYNSLFDTGLEFICRIGLCQRDTVIGATDKEILKFSEDTGIILPASVWSSARFFGVNSPLANSRFNLMTNLDDLKEYTEFANLREEWLDGMNVKEYLKAKDFKINYDYDNPNDNYGIYTPDLKDMIDVDNAIFFDYDSFTRTLRFIDGKNENPCVYSFNQYRSLTSAFVMFSNVFRHFLFLIILNYAPQQFKGNIFFRDLNINLNNNKELDYSGGYEFINRYQNLFRGLSNTKRIQLDKQRAVFYILNNEIEQKENRIMSCIEFENRFIQFILEKDITHL